MPARTRTAAATRNAPRRSPVAEAPAAPPDGGGGFIRRMKVADLLPARLKDNPRVASDERKAQLRHQLGELGNIQPITLNLDSGNIVSGNQRIEQYAELGQEETDVWCVRLTPQQERKAVVALNNHAGEFDEGKLKELLDEISTTALEAGADVDLELSTLGFDDVALQKLLDTGEHSQRYKRTAAHKKLSETFVVPPFSVLDARQGYWNDRKATWQEIGLRAEEGREHLLSTVCRTEGLERGGSAKGGGSLFDPVLCEVMYRWFCPLGGRILDPFAGEATKGIVAAVLSHPYSGVELRPEQVEANVRQWADVLKNVPDSELPAPVWTEGDSAHLDELLPTGEWADMVWTSPPYFDLEVYSGNADDGSTFVSYAKFMEWYADIFTKSVALLKPNRFLAVKIGEVRDKTTHAYHNFVGDNISLFRSLGLQYYNEAVLITPVGSLPVRAGRHFNAGRKLSKGHQNVLVFYKGDCRKIGEHFPALEMPAELTSSDAETLAGEANIDVTE